MRTIGIILLLLVCSVVYGATPRTLNGGCSFVFGDQSGSTLTDGQLGPQGDLCQLPENATLIEISIKADGGTPSVIVQRYRPNGGTTVDLTSSALSTGASGAIACSRPTASTSINGTTTCAATLQNTALTKGDWIQTKTGATASTAKRISVSVVWTW